MAEFNVTIFWKDDSEPTVWPGFEGRFEFEAINEARELLKDQGMLDEISALRADYVKQESFPMTMEDLDWMLGHGGEEPSWTR